MYETLSLIGLAKCKGLDEHPINVVTASPESLRLAYQSEGFQRRNRQAIENPPPKRRQERYRGGVGPKNTERRTQGSRCRPAVEHPSDVKSMSEGEPESVLCLGRLVSAGGTCCDSAMNGRRFGLVTKTELPHQEKKAVFASIQ
jgi:hypothetical protein